MGIRNSLLRFGSAVARTLGMTKVADAIKPDEAQAQVKGKNPSRYPRMIHLSKQVHELPDELSKLLGVKYIVDRGKGTTYRIGKNAMKRMADSMGGNNKQRRRIRSRMKRRYNELVAEREAAYA